jgi:type IV secretory pathway VirB10-like protein
MSNGLKDKLEEFIQGIKSKLSRKSDDDEDYDDEYEEELEDGEDDFDEKTEEIAVKKSSDDDDDDDEDDEEDEDDEAQAAAKKKQMIIRGVIAVIALYLAYDMFLGTPEEPVIQQKKITRKRKPRKKRVKKKTPVAKKAATKPAEDNKKVVKKPEPAPEPAPKVAPTPEPKVVETPPIEEPKFGELEMNKAKDMEKNSLGESSVTPEKEKDDFDNALDNLSENTPKMIKKVQKEKLEYQEPPNYQDTGRGLVYNCVGKHWACVDQASYLNCKKNADWSKENSKAPECFPSDVYQNFKDCRIIQVDKINTLSDTSFCK